MQASLVRNERSRLQPTALTFSTPNNAPKNAKDSDCPLRPNTSTLQSFDDLRMGPKRPSVP